MKNMSIFQLVLLGVFVLLAMAGLVVVAIYSSGGVGGLQPVKVKIWGTFDDSIMKSVIKDAGFNNQTLQVSYDQKSENTFDSDLAEAIAIGQGPDIVLIRQDFLVSNLKKIYPIPYERYPIRDFKDAFIEEGELFLNADGVLGVPFAIDPLVMFWNRDLFTQKGIANPPRYWDELYSVASSLTITDASKKITQSGVALGAYDNIVHAKEILSALFLQGGIAIADWNDARSAVSIDLLRSQTSPENILSFYAQFSDPRKSVVSWSPGLLDSESMFLSNRLAIYFGFASEAKSLKSKSPNLNFDVALFPQVRNQALQSTYGRLYALSVLYSSKSMEGALQVVFGLTSSNSIKEFSTASGLPSVRRDVKISKPDDPFQSVFVQSAFISHGWLDPKYNESNAIFRDMVNPVLAGFSTPKEVMSTAEQQLRYLIPR